MLTPEFWSQLDAAAGVPVEFTVAQVSTPTGQVIGVSTKAPLIYARRNKVSASQAQNHLENAITQVYVTYELTPQIRVLDSDTLLLEVDDDALWRTPPGPFTTTLQTHACDIRRTYPDVTLTKTRYPWADFTHIVGEDAALWAALMSASAHPPLKLGGTLETLQSRRDDNPFALICRAHAASVIRLESLMAGHDAYTGLDASEHRSTKMDDQPVKDTYLRATLMWANRVTYDTTRHERTRPLTLALEEVARTVIRHLEQTPVSRTDSLGVEAARTLFARSLECVNIAAPVPA